MQPTPGTRLHCVDCTTQVVVIRASSEDVSLTCGGHSLTTMLEPAVSGDAVVRSPADAGTQLGKRYAEESMGLELLCTKAGAGRLACNGKDLEIRSAKPLPSSD